MISSPGSSHTRKPNMGQARIDIGQPDSTFTEEWLPYRSVIRYAIGGGWGNETLKTGTGTVRIIRGTDFKNIHNGNLQGVPLRYETSRKISSRQLEDGDVILEISGGSRTSNQFTGRSFFVSQNLIDRLGGVVIPASFCRLVRFDEDRVAQKYAYYALQNMYLTGRAALYEQQSTGISNFQFEYFLDEEMLRVPPLPQQRRIAGILGALDDKIELNRRMNETLEQMARALYKSWFVDFDPVHAKMDGRWQRGESLTGLPAGLYDLFPDRLVPSELGQIPEGWTVKTLGDVCAFRSGSAFPKVHQGRPVGDYPFVKVSDMNLSHNKTYILGAANWVEEDSLPSLKGKPLPINTTVFAKIGEALKQNRLRVLALPALIDNNMMGAVPKPNEIKPLLLYGALSTFDFGEVSGGTALPYLTVTTLSSLSVPVPSMQTQTPLDQILLDLFERIRLSATESKALAAQRDALLPRLMSQQFQFLDVENVPHSETPQADRNHSVHN